MPIPDAVLRSYREDEEACVEARLREAMLPAELQGQISVLARELAGAVRAASAGTGFDTFLTSFDLGSNEGIALMCLAEALLRIPDAVTRDKLTADKIGSADRTDEGR